MSRPSKAGIKQSMRAERSGMICHSVAQALSVASRSMLRSTLRPFFKGRSPLRSN